MSENIETQQVQDDEISLLDLLQTVVDNLRLIVFGSLGAGVLALGVSFLIPPTYTAKTQFLPPQQQQSSASALIQSLGSMGGLAAAATGLKNPADQYIAFLKTQSIQDAMVDRFKLQERYDTKFKVDARKELLDNTKIQAGKDSIIQLEVEDKDPVFSAELANGYVTELRKLMGRLSITEAQQRRAFFENKLTEAKAELAQADKSLRSTGINATTLKSSPMAAVEMVAKLKGAVTAQEIKIGGMRGYLTDSAPEIKQALIELSIFRGQLAKAEKDDPTITFGKLEDSYVERYRDYKYKETLYEMFAKQYELARVDEAREGAIIQVIDTAQPPERKAKPKKAIIVIIATIVSGLVLLIFVFMRMAIHKAGQDSESANRFMNLKNSWRRAIGGA
jgi:tyrosine-protein kinase Etk/Wzc